MEVHAVAAGARLGLGDLVPELERALVVGERLGEGVPRLGRAGRREGRVEGARQVVGRVPVPRELGQARVVAVGPCLLEAAREGGVQARPLAREQVVVDGLLEQRVAERVVLVAGTRLGHQDVLADGFAQRGVQGLGVDARRVHEQVRVDVLARGGGHAQDLLGRVGQARDAGEQDVAERRRKLGRAGVPRRAQELLGEERVPVGPRVDRLDEARLDLVSVDRPELRGELGSVEATQVQPLDPAGAVELGEERQQRVAAVQLVRPVGHEEHDAGVAQVPDEEREQVAGRPVGPVQVLDDEEDRRPFGEPLQQREDVLEQRPLGRAHVERPGGRCDGGLRLGPALAVARQQVGDQAGEAGSPGAGDPLEVVRRHAACPGPQRLDDRPERDPAVADVHASARQDERALAAGDIGQLRGQARLADAGLAGQDELRCSGPARRHRSRPEGGRARRTGR